MLWTQGVGKNKLADELLRALHCEREYIQLHRDTTVQALTCLATLREGGGLVWEDSALVRAVRHGRVLVVDEADKAPLEVVCVLKALAEDRCLHLADGRHIAPPGSVASLGAHEDAGASETIEMHAGFRMVVLANPPGFPFQGGCPRIHPFPAPCLHPSLNHSHALPSN